MLKNDLTYNMETDKKPKELYNEKGEKHPIINCHTHSFTGDHVPPYLAKSILKWPLYLLVNFRWIFGFMRKYYQKKDSKRFDGTTNVKERWIFEWERKFRKNYIRYFIYHAAGVYLTIQVIDLLLHRFFSGQQKDPGWLLQQLNQLHKTLYEYKIVLDPASIWLQLLIVLAVLSFYKSGRNLCWFFAKNTISLFKKLPGKETKQLIERYMTIGRFAFHKTQQRTVDDLEDQYPSQTGFVILPMDMEYMSAGKPAISYQDQMKELAVLKTRRDNIYPFVFVDPRRIKEDPTYFDYYVENGNVILKDCFIKDYMEGHTVKDDKGQDAGIAKFSGFKIYPALGYYPFDPALLPLWKYAAQEGLPILTHSVKGPMYYRGKKERAWDYHPLFEELVTVVTQEGKNKISKDSFAKMLLPETKNEDFSANFTHPLNYLCLLKKEFLAVAVENAINGTSDKLVKDNLTNIFGFIKDTDGHTPIVTRGLDDLKICFAHFGGSEEWHRYFEKDRFKHSAQLAKRPDFGIDFVYLIKTGKSTATRSLGKPEQLWKFTDWYSIICSMMIQHENVYADISYILHDDAAILPLLKQTLQNPKLRQKILYGTDFYVVRNHKSDKNILADMMGGLDETDFDQIARINPRRFLNL